MTWERTRYHTDKGVEVETDMSGRVLEGPHAGKVVVRSKTSKHLYTNPEGEDLGRVTRHVMVGPSVTSTRVLDGAERAHVLREVKRNRTHRHKERAP